MRRSKIFSSREEVYNRTQYLREGEGFGKYEEDNS